VEAAEERHRRPVAAPRIARYYLYSVIGVVPNPTTEEFTNVAVIAGHANDWAMRYLPADTRTALGLDPELDSWLGGFLTNVLQHVDNGTFDEAELRDLHHRHRNVVQLSPPMSVVAVSADDAVNKVESRWRSSREG
jgi:hypothetical protein